MHDSIYFITPEGEEINLCNYYGDRTLYELVGRSGFEAPPVEYTDISYAHGFSKTVAVKIKPREVSINMVVLGKTTAERDKLLHRMISQLMISGQIETPGKLKVMRSDGKNVYLNCIYTGGVDAIVEEYALLHKFQLTFHAADPFFYDEAETAFVHDNTGQIGLFLSGSTFLGEAVYLSGGFATTSEVVRNDGQPVFPVITISGPGKTIRFENERSGKTLKMRETFEILPKEELKIDTREGFRSIVKVSGGETTDQIAQLDPGSSLIWPILQGDNLIHITITDKTIDTIVRFGFTKKYLSA